MFANKHDCGVPNNPQHLQDFPHSCPIHDYSIWVSHIDSTEDIAGFLQVRGMGSSPQTEKTAGDPNGKNAGLEVGESRFFLVSQNASNLHREGWLPSSN